MIILVVVLIIPSVLSAKQMVDKSTVSQNIQLLVSKELGNVNLIKQKLMNRIKQSIQLCLVQKLVQKRFKELNIV